MMEEPTPNPTFRTEGERIAAAIEDAAPTHDGTGAHLRGIKEGFAMAATVARGNATTDNADPNKTPFLDKDKIASACVKAGHITLVYEVHQVNQIIAGLDPDH